MKIFLSLLVTLLLLSCAIEKDASEKKYIFDDEEEVVEEREIKDPSETFTVGAIDLDLDSYSILGNEIDVFVGSMEEIHAQRFKEDKKQRKQIRSSETEFTPSYDGEDFVSLIGITQSSLDGQTDYYVRTWNYAKKDDIVVELADYISSEEALEQLALDVHKALFDRGGVAHHQLKEYTEVHPKNYQNWYISEDGKIGIVFLPGEVADMTSGLQYVELDAVY